VNFLAHLLLAGPDPELLTGNLMGDFVKGRLEGRFPPGIERGIVMHRRIDSFADADEYFNVSRKRLDPSFGLYRGVLVDLFYDHFLALSWNVYSPVPLDSFLRASHRTVRAHERQLPEQLRTLLPVIFSELLPSYLEPAGIDRALARMGRRIVRPNPLAEGGRELRRHYPELQRDFALFFPRITGFARMFAAGGDVPVADGVRRHADGG
jgi:acyl carrier protein phosphodiesterase